MKHSILFFWLLCFGIVSNAQNLRFKKDITEIADSSRVQKIINLLKGTPNPLIDSTNMVINRYIQSIGSLEGKIIRSINIEQRHFGNDVNRPTFQKMNALINFANQLHDKTNKSTIAKNIFIKVDEPLNPLLVAYNEKWLRDLGYIQDARILAYPNKEDTNKVDVFVVTKDILPIGGNFNLKEANAFELNLTTENINDLGNAFSISQNYDHDRKTVSGWGFDYTTRNILGSFLDLKTGAKSYTDNYANRMASASNVFISGNKPLLHPLDRWVYGFDIRQEKNRNAYKTWSDSFYINSLQYQLRHFDANIGYQLFFKNKIYQNDNLRYFVQLRYLENDFITLNGVDTIQIATINSPTTITVRGPFANSAANTTATIAGNSDVWNDRFLKKYATAKIKYQWGSNLTKFNGMTLPGNIQFSGEQILNDARDEIRQLEDEMMSSYSLPVVDMIG